MSAPASSSDSAHPFAALASALRSQSEYSLQSSATFNAHVLLQASQAVTGDGPDSAALQSVLESWRDRDVAQLANAAVGWRLMGALQNLALRGLEPELAAAYPGPAND